ncbi:methionyl-tRNA formyltransferase [Dethiothermospora halolimnae]|uniref:methionyl-tRNA formyltransferase n=1 Tax=Dethiothermospora halolimnae TaxID=3114390 RepID=UPI003CCBCB6C
MKVVFMGTPDFAVPTLEAIYKKGHNIELVVTQPDRPKGRGKKLTPPDVKVTGEALGLDIFQPENINDDDSIKKLEDVQPDVIVVVAYGQILKEEILNLPKYGCINVHGSLLPEYRGSAPINWVIIDGKKKTGVTTMYMEKGLDTGDMLLKAETDIKDNETAGELYNRLMDMGADLLIETLDGLENGTINRVPQDESKASYAKMMDKSLGKINWNDRAENIKNLVRGTQPWPGSFTKYKDKKIKIFKVEVCRKFKDGENGKVVKVDDTGIYVNTKDSCIVIKRLQFPGKKRMDVKDYLKGNQFAEGIVLS